MRIHIFHDWSKWEGVKDGETGETKFTELYDADGGRLVAAVYHLRRSCETCGLDQFQRVEL